MNSEMTDLAREAVACDGWRWMEGMRPFYKEIAKEYRLTYLYVDGEYVEIMESGGPDNPPAWGWPSPKSGWLPDLTDPATLGCLLHLVRESLDLFGVSTHYIFDPPHMCFQVRNPVEVYSYAVREVGIGEHTEKEAREIMKVLEVEALVAALKAGGHQ